MVQQAAASDAQVLIDVERHSPGAKQRSRRFAPLTSAGALVIGSLVVAVVVMSARNRDQGVPGKPESAAIRPTNASAKGDEGQLAQDAMKPEPEPPTAPETTGPAPGDQSDVAADSDTSTPATGIGGGVPVAPRKPDAKLKLDADVPDFFTDDDSDAPEPKAPSTADDEDFFSDDEMSADQVGEAKDFFDSENLPGGQAMRSTCVFLTVFLLGSPERLTAGDTVRVSGTIESVCTKCRTVTVRRNARTRVKSGTFKLSDDTAVSVDGRKSDLDGLAADRGSTTRMCSFAFWAAPIEWPGRIDRHEGNRRDKGRGTYPAGVLGGDNSASPPPFALRNIVLRRLFGRFTRHIVVIALLRHFPPRYQ